MVILPSGMLHALADRPPLPTSAGPAEILEHGPDRLLFPPHARCRWPSPRRSFAVRDEGSRRAMGPGREPRRCRLCPRDMAPCGWPANAPGLRGAFCHRRISFVDQPGAASSPGLTAPPPACVWRALFDSGSRAPRVPALASGARAPRSCPGEPMLDAPSNLPRPRKRNVEGRFDHTGQL